MDLDFTDFDFADPLFGALLFLDLNDFDLTDLLLGALMDLDFTDFDSMDLLFGALIDLDLTDFDFADFAFCPGGVVGAGVTKGRVVGRGVATVGGTRPRTGGVGDSVGARVRRSSAVGLGGRVMTGRSCGGCVFSGWGFGARVGTFVGVWVGTGRGAVVFSGVGC